MGISESEDLLQRVPLRFDVFCSDLDWGPSTIGGHTSAARTDKESSIIYATRLQWACLGGYKEIVEVLLEKGGYALIFTVKVRRDVINVQKNDGWTALHLAASQGRESIAGSLLARDADMRISTKDGSTASHIAMKNRHERMIQILLVHGADPNLQVLYEWTSLIFAAGYGPEDAVKLLLASNADLNLRSIDGQTPLYVTAAFAGLANTITLLLNAGSTLKTINAIWIVLYM